MDRPAPTVEELVQPEPDDDPDRCPKCGVRMRPGYWPFCNGNRADHQDPHYDWHWSL